MKITVNQLKRVIREAFEPVEDDEVDISGVCESLAADMQSWADSNGLKATARPAGSRRDGYTLAELQFSVGSGRAAKKAIIWVNATYGSPRTDGWTSGTAYVAAFYRKSTLAYSEPTDNDPDYLSKTPFRVKLSSNKYARSATSALKAELDKVLTLVTR